MSDPTTNEQAKDATTGDPAVAAAERDVERNREQLAETVDALHAKLDVKTKAQDKVHELKERATDESGKPRPQALAAAAAAVLGITALLWWRHRR
jgi:hypothetical protein